MTSAAATEGGGMKTVPTGHMYRQMFEAEVQLVNSLANSKATRREKRQAGIHHEMNDFRSPFYYACKKELFISSKTDF